MVLGLADYLQLALISVSFDSVLSLLPYVLSLKHHAGCWAPFCPEAPPQSRQQSWRVILGLQPVVPEGLPTGISIWGGRGLLHLTFPGGSLISLALQSCGAGCAVPLPR